MGSGVGAPRLQTTGSVVGALRLSCFVAGGTSPVQAFSPSPAWAGTFLTTEPPGTSSLCFLKAHTMTSEFLFVLVSVLVSLIFQGDASFLSKFFHSVIELVILPSYFPFNDCRFSVYNL